MRTLLCIPDEKPIASDLIVQCKSFGFNGARCDVSEDHALATAQIRSFVQHSDFFPIFLLFGGTMQRFDGKPWQPKDMLQATRDECVKLHDLGFVGRGLAIEFGNEPDLAHRRWKHEPEELGRLYKEAIGVVKGFSSKWHCLSPSISNLDQDSLRYLERMQLPVGAEVAFHRYPPDPDFWSFHDGFQNRLDEVRRLERISNGAPLWLTETGWAEHNKRYTLTEAEVADRIKREVRYFWGERGIEAIGLYQINSAVVYAGDSDDDKRLASYGARRPNGEWKPWATAVKEAVA